jgi:hypothetical protein
VKLRPDDPADMAGLLTQPAYDALVKSGQH